MDADERRKMLYAEFQLVDTDHDGVFTKQDLFRYLDRRNGGLVFDRGLANELFDQMEKDKDDRVTFNEFLNIWAESDRILSKRIAEDRMLIANAQSNKKKLDENLNKLKATRGTNSNPYLRLIIREVRGIESERYVIAVQCLGQIFQTGAITSKNAVVNFFMEFFAGAAHGEELTFKVLDLVNPAKAQQIGTFSIAALKDQLKHDEWIILNRQDGVRSDSRVLVTMQHVVSEAEYYQNISSKWDVNIKELEDDIKKCEDYKKQIQSPNDFLLTVAYGDFYVQRLVPTQNLGTNHGIDGAYAVEQLPVPTTIHPLAKVSLIIGLLMLICCLMQMFHRCDFPSAAVALLLIGLFFLDRDNTKHGVRLTAGINFVAFVMTITWLILYTKNFWNTIYIDANTFEFGRKWEVVVTFVQLGLQFLTFVLLFQLHRIAVVKESKRSTAVLLPIPIGGGGATMLQPMYGGGGSRANTNAMLSNMNTEGFFIEKPGGFVANTGIQQRPTGPGYQPPVGGFEQRGPAQDPFAGRPGPTPAGGQFAPPGPGAPPAGAPGMGGRPPMGGPTPTSTGGGF